MHRPAQKAKKKPCIFIQGFRSVNYMLLFFTLSCNSCKNRWKDLDICEDVAYRIGAQCWCARIIAMAGEARL